MPRPFRQPVSDEIEPPDYVGKPIEESSDKPPSYAGTPIEEKKEAAKPRSFKPVGAQKFYKSTKGAVDKASEFAKGVASSVLPSTTPKDYLEGPVYAIRHPLDSASLLAGGLFGAHKEQYDKARESIKQGRYSEAIGHGAAAALPLIGPMAASAGEDIGEGRISQGLGKATGLLAPFAIKGLRGVPETSKGEGIISKARDIPAPTVPNKEEPSVRQVSEESNKLAVPPELGPEAFTPKDYKQPDIARKAGVKPPLTREEEDIEYQKMKRGFDERDANKASRPREDAAPQEILNNPFKGKKPAVTENVKPTEEVKPPEYAGKPIDEMAANVQMLDASKASPESLKKLNEFMDSVPKEGEQSVEQLKAGINEVPPIKMPTEATESSIRQTPTSSHGPTEEYFNSQKYDLKFASDAQDAASKSRSRGMKNWAAKKAKAAEAAKAGIKPEEAIKPAEAAEPQGATETQQTPELRAHDIQKPATMAERATSRLQDAREAAKERISKRGTFKGGRLLSGLPVDDLADFAVIGASHIAEGAIKFADWSTRMIKDFGDEIKPHLQKIFAAAQEQHTGNSVKELLNSLVESKGMNAEQQELYKTQRAARFKAFESAGGEGVDWAKKAMSTLKGEYEKVNPGEGLGLTSQESNSLFSAVKQAPISTPEKARGIATLFKLMNGDSNLQTNEIDLLDKIFEKHFGPVSGPGAAMPYDIKSGGKPITFSEAISKKPDDFLTKLANFSSKATRSVLGFHVPGTAISFHGFNEAIRNTVFGPDFNPFKAAGRFGQASYYLARPAKAAEFLDVHAEELAKAMEEGGLKASTGDIGQSSFFKGDNIITKGINALTDPKPLFGQVIPALKLKSYNGLLQQYEKSGMKHEQAAKLAGYATNNIFGGLNLHELQRSQNTQKLFRAAALAPDWLESNVRLSKGMFDAIKNPKAPESKVYLTGMANFLGSYVALNVLNAINNNGRFSFQNEVGHEFDIATGKDSAGRTRYFSPYGTAMDMFRIPLEIAHSAVEGNTGKAFSDMRSRASEPVQFMTDLMTNTDYAGRSLYDKTKYGKHIPALTQGANIAGDAASHFLPIGAESAINLSQGKVSPEQFASQVLQLPMKYKTPERPSGSLRLRNMRALKP